MRTWSKFLMCFGIMGALVSGGVGQPTGPTGNNAAIQAIQQAPDPSAAVAAYANGFAIDGKDPKLDEAYVARMIDLGLPEMAYHQAQTLTTLDSRSGLGWAVVAYVDARRAEMQDALSAIILAGQFAPDNKFVQQTAGEILAWYDVKADKTQLPPNTKEGVARLHHLFDANVAFTSAYQTATKAYQTQSSSAPAPTQGELYNGQAPPPYSTATAPLTPPAYAYYPDYYGWGPGWVQPAPWWWWQPAGFFFGYSFCPFGTFFVFDDFHHFHNHSFHHHDGSVHNGGFFVHNGFHGNGLVVHNQGSTVVVHGQGSGVVAHDAAHTGAFFGAPARVDSSIAGLGHVGIASGVSGTAVTRGGMAPPSVHSTAPSSVSQWRSFSGGGAATGIRAGPAAGMAGHGPVVSAPSAPLRSSAGFAGGGAASGGVIQGAGAFHGSPMQNGGGFHTASPVQAAGGSQFHGSPMQNGGGFHVASPGPAGGGVHGGGGHGGGGGHR